MPSTRATIIVPASHQAAANAWMKANVDHQGGEFTFTSPLTSDGTSITHYWASGLFSDDQYEQIVAEYGPELSEDDPTTFRDSLNLQPYSQE